MKEFIFKVITFVLIGFIIYVFMIMVFVIFNKIEKNNLPKNNLANSHCFRAKLDHAIVDNRLNKCTFLISGSSISMNNISGSTLQKATNEIVYNISSSGTLPQQTLELMNNKVFGEKLRYILVAFNNVDFGEPQYHIDYKSASQFFRGNSLERSLIFLKTFNLTVFTKDIFKRVKFSSVSNVYESLKFDQTGSVLLDRKGFVIDERRWETYYDTVGFSKFFKSICHLNELCKKNSIELYLIYVPFRSDLLSESRMQENREVSKLIRSKFHSNFYDFSNFMMTSDYFSDNQHFFREGSECITNLLLDSLQLKGGNQTKANSKFDFATKD